MTILCTRLLESDPLSLSGSSTLCSFRRKLAETRGRMTKITNTAQLSAQTHEYARRSAETLRRRYYLGDLAQMSCSQSPQPFASFGGWLAGAPAFFWLANHTSQGFQVATHCKSSVTDIHGTHHAYGADSALVEARTIF